MDVSGVEKDDDMTDGAQGPQSGEGDTEGWDSIPTSHQVFIRRFAQERRRWLDLDCFFAAHIISSGVSPQSGEGVIDFDSTFAGD